MRLVLPCAVPSQHVAARAPGRRHLAGTEQPPPAPPAAAAAQHGRHEGAVAGRERAHGAARLFDDADQLGFQSAEGRFASPSSAEALITVEAFGFTTEVGAVVIDGTLRFTNPLSGAWSEAPESLTFDPATPFDADVGFPALLTEARPSAELVDDGPDEGGGDGDSQHHVRTTASAERVSVLTGGLVTEESDIDLWIDADSSRIVEARFDVSVDDAVSSWRLTLGDYDAEITIVAPELGTDG